MAEPTFLALSGATAPATPSYAGQPGPGQPPNPWRVDGATVFYDEGGVVMPRDVPGLSKGKGTLNAHGLFIDGAPPAGGGPGGGITSIFAGVGIVMTPNPILATGEVKFDSALLLPYAPLASPALSGTPTAPTASPGTSTAQLATTAFVAAAVAAATGGLPFVGDNPPAVPIDNQIWWKSNSGTAYIRYNDGNSVQWVPLIAVGAQGPPGLVMLQMTQAEYDALDRPDPSTLYLIVG